MPFNSTIIRWMIARGKRSEMGIKNLLTRAGEIEIAKRIEDGSLVTMRALSNTPTVIERFLSDYDKIIENDGNVSDLISGFIDDTEDDPNDAIQKSTDVEITNVSEDEDIENTADENIFDSELDLERTSQIINDIRLNL